MLHLAATETYYQMNTFEGMKWDCWPESIKKKWDPAMGLGDAGRKTIKGHDRDYYLNILQETRAKSLAEFKKRDDAWLMAVDKDWPWGPTNNYCKWFHVCEHEAHHTGQIALLRKRLPGAKPIGGVNTFSPLGKSLRAACDWRHNRRALSKNAWLIDRSIVRKVWYQHQFARSDRRTSVG